jgi:type IV fimbrial biogenesis protein FimT
MFNKHLTISLQGLRIEMDSSNTPVKQIKPHLSQGFTLIEFLVTLTILTTTMVLAVPAFQAFVLNARMSAKVNGLVNALNYARSNALSQIISVSLCPFGALNSTTCGANWSAGWIVVTQPIIGSPVLLQSYQSQTNNPVLSAAGVTVITFNTRGLPNNSINFKLCDSRGATYARSVEVLLTGFIQSGAVAGQAVWDGSTLTCP